MTRRVLLRAGRSIGIVWQQVGIIILLLAGIEIVGQVYRHHFRNDVPAVDPRAYATATMARPGPLTA